MYEFTPADPTRERPGHSTFPAEKRKILFLYIPLISFVSMMSGIIFVENEFVGVANVVFGIVVNFLALMWVKLDSQERHYELSQFYPVAVILFGVFAVIYYLFRSRSSTEAGKSVGWLALYILALVAVLTFIAVIISLALIATGVLPQSVLGSA